MRICKIIIFIFLTYYSVQSQNSINIFDVIRRNDQNTLKTILGGSPFDKNQRDSIGDTPLMNALKLKYFNLAKLILEKVNSSEIYNLYNLKTPLHVLFENLDGSKSLNTEVTKICRILLDSGANVDGQDEDGETPLHVLSRKGNINYINLLLEYAPDLTLKNNKGQTTIDVAPKRVKEKLINLEKSLEYKLNFNIKNLKRSILELKDKKNNISINLKIFKQEKDELENEIRSQRKIKRFINDEEALQDETINNVLKIIKEKTNYIDMLINSDSTNTKRLENLRFYWVKAQDELRIYKTLGDEKVTNLISQIDEVLRDNNSRSDKIYTPNRDSIPDISLKEIYNKIK